MIAELESYISTYVTLEPSYALVIALWLAATHAWLVFDAFPYLVVTSATKRSGKSRLLELMHLVASNSRLFANISPAAIYRTIEAEKPTLLIDEAEMLSSAKSEYRSLLGRHGSLWRVDITGRNLQPIPNTSLGVFPDCSPDGNWVIYSSESSKGFRLMRVSVAGGSAETLLEKPLVLGRYSPDGTQIGLLMGEGERASGGWKLGVMDARTGLVNRTFGVSDVSGDGEDWVLRWTADGKGLTLPKVTGGSFNLWVQPVSGGMPHQITHSGDPVVSYAWSPDGKRLAITQESSSRDVVLVRKFH